MLERSLEALYSRARATSRRNERLEKEIHSIRRLTAAKNVIIIATGSGKNLESYTTFLRNVKFKLGAALVGQV